MYMVPVWMKGKAYCPLLVTYRTTPDALVLTREKNWRATERSPKTIQGPSTAKLMSGALWLALALIPTPSFFFEGHKRGPYFNTRISR